MKAGIDEKSAEAAARAEGWEQKDSRFVRQGVAIAYVNWTTLCREENIPVTVSAAMAA